MYFEIYLSSGEWRWRLKAANHEIIASGEGYKDYLDCCRAIDLLKATNEQTPVNYVY